MVGKVNLVQSVHEDFRVKMPLESVALRVYFQNFISEGLNSHTEQHYTGLHYIQMKIYKGTTFCIFQV